MSVCLCPLLNLFLSLGFLCLVEFPAMVSPPVAVAALHWTCLPVALSTPHDTMEHPGPFHSNIWVQIFVCAVLVLSVVGLFESLKTC